MQYRVLPPWRRKNQRHRLGNRQFFRLRTANGSDVRHNLIDIGSIYQEPFFPALAKALDGRRDQVFTQSHFGMVYKDGRCGPSKRLDEIKAQLRRFTPIIRILA